MSDKRKRENIYDLRDRTDYPARQRAPFEASEARRGIDALLRAYPHLDIVLVQWKPTWVLIDLGQPGEKGSYGEDAWAVWQFAVFRATGAVHTLDHMGAVSDDPILTP
jgi:hypothetical protein